MSDRGETFKHESFGSIYAAHKSGSGKPLFMAPKNRHHSINLRIGRGTLTRDLSHDFFHGDNDIIVDVEMSAAQWAHFVSSPNTGTGTPCTLRYYRDGNLIEAAPPPAVHETRETFSQELRDHAKKMLAGVRSAIGAIDRMLAGGAVSKTTLREARDDLSKALHNDLTDSGLGYTMKQAEGWLDRMVNDARTEAEAAAMMGMKRLALDAIANQMTAEEREATTRKLLGPPAP